MMFLAGCPARSCGGQVLEALAEPGRHVVAMLRPCPGRPGLDGFARWHRKRRSRVRAETADRVSPDESDGPSVVKSATLRERRHDHRRSDVPDRVAQQQAVVTLDRAQRVRYRCPRRRFPTVTRRQRSRRNRPGRGRWSIRRTSQPTKPRWPRLRVADFEVAPPAVVVAPSAEAAGNQDVRLAAALRRLVGVEVGGAAVRIGWVVMVAVRRGAARQICAQPPTPSSSPDRSSVLRLGRLASCRVPPGR